MHVWLFKYKGKDWLFMNIIRNGMENDAMTKCTLYAKMYITSVAHFYFLRQCTFCHCIILLYLLQPFAKMYTPIL